MRIPMAAFFGSGNVKIIVIVAVLAVLVCGAGAVHAQRTDEFNVVMNAAIATNGAQVGIQTADLKTAIIANDSTTPLVLDVRPNYEYATGHINGSINIYYRDLGKDSALNYLNSSLEAHIGAGKKNEIVPYGNTRHLSRMIPLYLNTQGYTARALVKGFSEWTSDAPGRFVDCTSFDANGRGTSPVNCTSNNFPTTTTGAVDVDTQSGEGYPVVDCISGTATSADLAEITRCMYDARFGDLSKPEFRITAAELYDMLDDNQDGVINGSDNSANDPYVLSNRGTTWTDPYPDGPYYTAGHIPGAVAVDWASTAYALVRQDLRVLNQTDFMPTDRTVVHHCWVGVSQQFGAVWYNLLGYTVQSLDWGVQGWTNGSAVRGAVSDIVVTSLDYSYETGDGQALYIGLNSPSNNSKLANRTITFRTSVLLGGTPNVTLWGNWSGGWGLKGYNDTAENITGYNFTVTVPDGTWVWKVNLTDDSSNVNWSSDEWTINVDATPPNVTIDSPVNRIYNTTNDIWINVTVWDGIEGNASTLNVTAELVGIGNRSLQRNSSSNWTYYWGGIPDGSHTIRIYANDSMGNMNGTETVNFTVDVLSPYVQDSYVPLNVYIDRNWSINVTWIDVGTSVDAAWIVRNDTGSIKYFYDSKSGDEYSWYNYNETSLGQINVTVYANDTNNNTNSTSFIYTVVDSTSINLDSPVDGGYYNTTNITISGTVVTLTTANVSYSLNNGGIISIEDSTTAFSAWNDSTVEGQNNLTIYAVNYEDPADNTSTNISFYVDTIYPKIGYNSDTTLAGNYSQDWIFVNVSINETNIDTITLEGVGTNDTNWNVTGGTNYWWNKSAGDEDYTIRVYVTDSAGNTNATSPRAITLDMTAPVITIGSPASAAISASSGSVALNYSITENNLNWSAYSLNGKPNVTLSGNTTLPHLIDGQYNVTIYANDSAGNSNSTTRWFNISSSSVEDRYENESFDIPANESVRIDPPGSNWTIEITTNAAITGGAINITLMSSTESSEANFTMTGPALDIYLQIDVSDNIKDSLTYAMVELNYTSAEVSAAGISAGSLRPYRWNSSESEWVRLVGSLSWVNDAGVNTTENFVWANVTNLSVYGVGGSLIPAPPVPRGEGGGPIPPKTIFARAVLTTADDWRYAMMAAGFAAANDYILITVPTHSIDLPTRNNIKWFDELIIVGDGFVISDGLEDEFVKLRKNLVPGFAKLNTTRVKGANFFGTAVQLAGLWKDPKGIIVVRGDVFADALVAGQLSAATDSPILYTMPGEMWPWALYTIERMKLDVTIVGGEKAVSKKVEDAIKATGVNVRRVGGKDRYETAALIGNEYIKAAENKGKDIDTITFLSGKKGEWASTLGFRSYVYNSTILYVEEVEGQSAVPTPTKNFIAAHPDISSASIVINNGAKPKGYKDVDAYIKDMEFEVDPAIHTWEMDLNPDKKDYTLDTSTGGLSTTASQIVIESLGASGVLSGPSASGGGGGDGGGGQ